MTLPIQRCATPSEKIFEKTMEKAPATPEAAVAPTAILTDVLAGRHRNSGDRGRSRSTQAHT